MAKEFSTKKFKEYKGSNHTTKSIYKLSPKDNKPTLIKRNDSTYRVEMNKTTIGKKGKIRSRQHFFEANSMKRVKNKLATYLSKNDNGDIVMRWDYKIYEY